MVEHEKYNMGNNPDMEGLSKESKLIWDKMLIFKKMFEDQKSSINILKETLTKVTLELSLVKNENSRLNEKLEEQRSSITKYQQILKDLVEVEDRYCKLLVEKKKADEELSSEKKLRLELKSKWNREKEELEKSLHDELNVLKEHAAAQENNLKGEFSKEVEDQKLEIKSLTHQLSEAHKKHEEEVTKMKQDLLKSQREISRLKIRPRGQEKLMIINNLTLKPIVQEGANGTIIRARDNNSRVGMTSLSPKHDFEDKLEGTQDYRNCRTTEQVEVPRNVCSRRSVLPNKLPLYSEMASDQRNNSQSESTPELQNSEHQGGRKCNALEVFRVPSRIPKKSPLKKKRKLYCRTDDTI